MREIDPIREPSEALLSSALHRLASATIRSAPPELGANLEQAFRKHHQRRRRTRRAIAGALILSFMLLAALGVIATRSSQRMNVQKPVVSPAQQATVPAPADSSAKIDRSGPSGVKQQKRLPVVAERRLPTEEGFIALPGYDTAMTSGELQVVRLELTGSDLRLVGAPVAADLSDRRLMADFVVDRDGTPYAVRFVQ